MGRNRPCFLRHESPQQEKVHPVGPKMMSMGLKKEKVKIIDTAEFAKSVQPHLAPHLMTFRT